MATRTDVSAPRRIDRYVLEEELGRGGMGVVYAARDTHVDRRVALKVLPPALADDPTFVARFEQEIGHAAALEHPHVVPVYDVGRRDGNLFLAMRLIEGDDLRAIVARGGPLEPVRAGRIARQIGSALDAAHQRGIIHRDVKPGNILLTGPGEDEHAYLLDFGLARPAAAAQAQLTAPGEWIGTLDYAAPEQIAGVPLRPAADVYALGCVLFFALTGRPPFDGTMQAKIAGHTHEPLPSVGGPVAAAVDPVLAQATHKDPACRHASAAELGRAFAAAVGTAISQPQPVPEESETRVMATVVPRRRRSGRPGWLVPAALALAAAVAAVLVVGGLGDDGKQPAGAKTGEAGKTATTAHHKRPPKAPATIAYTAPAGGWTAQVPHGAGWQTQGETTVGGVLRTVFTGPRGAQVWVDATPSTSPAFGTEGRTDIRTEQYTTALGTVRSYRFRGQPDFCASGCLDDQLDLGGHGYAVLAGPTVQSRMAGRRIMRTLQPAAAAPAQTAPATTTAQQAPPAKPAGKAPPGKAKKPKKAKDASTFQDTGEAIDG